MKDLAAFILTVTPVALGILLYFFVYKPKQDAKNEIKQKAAKDRDAKRQADIVFSEYPTISRHCTNECFSETELGYSLPATRPM